MTNPLNERSMPKKMRERMIKRIMDIQVEHFIPVHQDTYEEIDEDNDRMLQMSLRTHELLHKEWAVPMKNRRTGW